MKNDGRGWKWEEGALEAEASLPIAMRLSNKPEDIPVLPLATRKSKSDSKACRVSLQRKDTGRNHPGERASRSFGTHLSTAVWTAPSCPGKRNPRAGVRVQWRPNPAPTRLPKLRDSERVLPAPVSVGANLLPASARARAAPGPRLPERGRAGLRLRPVLALPLRSGRSPHFRGAGSAQCWRWQPNPE